MRIVVADLEANGLLREATKVWCGCFKDIKTKERWSFRPHQIQEMLEFMDTCDVMIMHNGIAYDWPLLEKLHNYKYKGTKVDTLIMSRLQSPNRKLPFNMPKGIGKVGAHSVQAWGYRVGRGKVEHEDWHEFSEDMMHRCEEDVEIQHLIYNALLEEAKGMGWGNAWKLTFNLFDILHKQEEYGWLADRPYMDKSISLLTHWIRKIDKAVTPSLPLIRVINETKKDGEFNYVRKPFLKSGEYAAITKRWYEDNQIDSEKVSVCGVFSRISYRTVDLDSNMETKDYLLSQGWQPEEWNYKKDDKNKKVKDENGNYIRTSPKLSYKDSFIGINGGIGRLVARRVQCRHRRSSIEGWIDLIREDGRISSRVTGIATTGRMKHAGIVNIPGGDSFFGKQMRRCFTCKEGYVLVGTDSAACQLRMLAGRMNDASYTHEILHGDMHTANQLAAGLATRAQAKTFIYGFLFGAGDAKIGEIVGGGKKEGKDLKEKFLAGLPALGKLVGDLTEEWRANAKSKNVVTKWGVRKEYYDGWVRGLDGRPIFIESEHQVLVYMLQSDEAIMMSAAYIMAYKRLCKKYKWGEDFGIVCFYHDEYTIECKEEIAEDVARICEQAIVDAGNFFNIECPHEGDANIGNNWWDIH